MLYADGNKQDKMRLCPSCRMEISVLATKCRYCGEPVGRPKLETRQLTAEDLGESGGCQYAPSGNVMDALEAFRVEEFSTPPTEEDDRYSRGGPYRRQRTPHFSSDDSAPPMDEHGGIKDPLQLDASTFGRSHSSQGRSTRGLGERTRPKPKSPPPWNRYIVLGISLVVVAGFLVFGIPAVKAYFSPPPVVSSYVNKAPQILSDNGSPLDALHYAVEAVKEAPGTENSRILDSARQYVVNSVDTLLTDSDWTVDKINKASELISQAVAIDPTSDLLVTMHGSVADELATYKMVISDPVVVEGDGRGSTITFQRTGPDGRTRQIIAREGDVVANRFKVIKITSRGVRCHDMLRKDDRGRFREVNFDLSGKVY